MTILLRAIPTRMSAGPSPRPGRAIAAAFGPPVGVRAVAERFDPSVDAFPGRPIRREPNGTPGLIGPGVPRPDALPCPTGLGAGTG